MKVYVLLSIVIGIVIANARFTFAQISDTTVSGDVGGIWTAAKSPYIVIGHVTVPRNQELEIRPGVRVLFTGHYKFNVYGLLRAVGKPDSIIHFESFEPTIKWKGIRFFHAHDSSVVRYCRIQHGYASAGDYNGGGVSIEQCSPTLNYNVICDNRADNFGGGIYIIGRSASPKIDGNYYQDH